MTSACDGACDCGCCTGVEVETPVAVTNPPGQPAIAFRTGTYGQFLSSMLARLSSPAFPALSGLTVRSPDDPAIALLDGFSIVGDLLTFYSERIANEGYLRTATQDLSLRRLGRLVGFQARPGVAASTYVAYMLDQDPAVGPETQVTIPMGARSQSVPGAGEDPQSFEIGADLVARWSWNDLKVRQRQTYQVADGQHGPLYVTGAANNVKLGDRILLVFGTGTGEQTLQVVSKVDIDQVNGITVVGLPAPTGPTPGELVGRLSALAEEARAQDVYSRSRIVQRYVDGVLGTHVTELVNTPTDPTGIGARVADAITRLAETTASAQQYENVRRWLHEWLRPRLLRLRDQVTAAAQRLPAATPAPVPLHAALRVAESTSTPSTLALGPLLGPLRLPAAQPPPTPADLARDPQQLYGQGSDLGAQLLAALDPALQSNLYPAWQNVQITDPQHLQELRVIRTVATPFGATAPLKAQYDNQGKLLGYVDWPLTGVQTLDMRIEYTQDQTTPQQAFFTWTETGRNSISDAVLNQDGLVDVGPGSVSFALQLQTPPPPPQERRPQATQPVETGVVFTLNPNLPNRVITVSTSANGGTGPVTITIANPGNPGVTPPSFPLAYGQTVNQAVDGLNVRLSRTAPTNGVQAEVQITLQPPLPAVSQNIIALDAQYDDIGPGSWVAIQRPSKGNQDSPGNHLLAEVFTQVTSSRIVSKSDFGVTGKVSELTLVDNWLDATDTSLADIRDTTVYTRGDPLSLATQPITDDISGDTIELDLLYQGLTSGRWIVVTGERTDIPNTTGVAGTELTMIGSVAQTVDITRPGDTVHTVLTLATPLSYTYLRTSVHVYANVAPATNGASRDEPIGSGDASQANQSFTLFGHPVTWLASDTPLGASSTLQIRVDGVLWSEVDSFAGLGPTDKVYTTTVDDSGTLTITFGDGVHGARLTTGNQNVRASYRVGIGKAANVLAGKVTQLITRPLWVSAVNNPLPATGGADPDDASQMRRAIPLSVTALDRLVSVPDYAEFAVSRAGIGRAAARRLSDGARQVVHVTVTGVDDVPLSPTSDVVRTLQTSLMEFGDPQLPVQVAVRELVLLVVSASVHVDATHEWVLVEPLVRAALLAKLGFAPRDLGQPAYLSDAVLAVQAVPGVDYVDVDVFAGVPGSTTPAQLDGLAATLVANTVVPAQLATYDVRKYVVGSAPGATGTGETVAAVASENGITVADLIALNPEQLAGLAPDDVIPNGWSLVVYRGIRPAQLVLLSPDLPDTLILKEIRP